MLTRVIGTSFSETILLRRWDLVLESISYLDRISIVSLVVYYFLLNGSSIVERIDGSDRLVSIDFGGVIFLG